MAQKSILITGCSSGIGYDAAHGLKARGWRVFATCRKPRDCERLRGEGLESFQLDYADEASITAAVQEVVTRTGGTLDALFNNGAFASPGALEDLPRKAMSELFETNVFGYHDLTRQVIPLMRAQGHGRIINNSSVLGMISMKWRGAYVASKYALEGMTDTLRMEMSDTPLHIILIEPGPITSSIRVKSIPQFVKWIDWKNSVRKEQYETKLMKRLYKTDTTPDKFELPASAVTEKLVHALENKNPHPRYFVTRPTYVANLLRRFTTTRMRDRIWSGG